MRCQIKTPRRPFSATLIGTVELRQKGQIYIPLMCLQSHRPTPRRLCGPTLPPRAGPPECFTPGPGAVMLLALKCGGKTAKPARGLRRTARLKPSPGQGACSVKRPRSGPPAYGSGLTAPQGPLPVTGPCSTPPALDKPWGITKVPVQGPQGARPALERSYSSFSSVILVCRLEPVSRVTNVWQSNTPKDAVPSRSLSAAYPCPS